MNLEKLKDLLKDPQIGMGVILGLVVLLFIISGVFKFENELAPVIVILILLFPVIMLIMGLYNYFKNKK